MNAVSGRHMGSFVADPDVSSKMLASFAASMDAAVPVVAAFVAAAVEVGHGELGVAHLADQLGEGRHRPSEWFDGVVAPVAVGLLQVAEDAGDLSSGARLAAAATGARLCS